MFPNKTAFWNRIFEVAGHSRRAVEYEEITDGLARDMADALLAAIALKAEEANIRYEKRGLI